MNKQEKQRLTFRERQTYLLTEDDRTDPYRVTAPSLTLKVSRFPTFELAKEYLDEVAHIGHQAILSFVDIKDCRIKVMAYAPPKVFKRKAG